MTTRPMGVRPEHTLDVSLCTSCMNRNRNLEIALQTWLFLPVKEIFIVDWSCDQPLDYLLKEDYRIKVIRVDGKKYYHHSAANNLKFKYTKTKYIMAVDADVLVNDLFFEGHELNENIFHRGHGHTTKGVYGTFLGAKKWFEAIGGFNENLCHGWGYEDDDMYKRLEALGKFMAPNSFALKDIKREYVIHIPHSNDVRIEHQEDQDMVHSLRDNTLAAQNTSWDAKSKKIELNEKFVVDNNFIA